MDSRGNAWVPGHMVQISLISDSGQISGFKFAYGIEQVAEAAHGHMWFVDVTVGRQARESDSLIQTDRRDSLMRSTRMSSGFPTRLSVLRMARSAPGYTREDFAAHIRNEHSTFRWLLESIRVSSGFEVERADFSGLICTARIHASSAETLT